MTDLVRDFRAALRGARQAPGLTATIVLTLALGIGANTALFTYVCAWFWPTVDAPRPEELVSLHGNRKGAPAGLTSYPDLLDLEGGQRVFRQLAGARPGGTSIEVGGQTVFAWAYMVGGDYFALFGKSPAQGRWLGPDDDRPGAPRAMVLSFPYWRRYFGADPGVIGKSVLLGGRFPYTVVGVAPEGFQGQGLAENVYVPLAHWADVTHDLDDRSAARITAFARLRTGVSREAAEKALAGLARGLDETFPLDEPRRFSLVPLAGLHAGAVDEGLGRRAEALMGVVAILLLLASANVANLLLARAVGRRRELAVRAALGAGRLRLVRGLAVEGLLLAGAGGAAGAGLGWAAARVLEPLLYVVPVGMGPWGEGSRLFSFDGRMLAFSLLAALLTAVLFASAPALELMRSDLVTPLKSDSTGGTGRRGGGPRRPLVVVQVALGVILLLAAGLLLRTLQEITASNPGFSVDRLLLASLYIPDRELAESTERSAVYQGVRDRLAAVPGVAEATLTARPPLFGGSFHEVVRIPGGAAGPEPVTLDTNMVGPRYFETLGLSLLRGRAFRATDRGDGPGVAIVNQTFVERFFPAREAPSPAAGTTTRMGEGALGRRIALVSGRMPAEAGRSFEIVGVAADSRYYDPATKPGALVYFPVAQRPLARMTALVRARGAPSALADDLRSVLSREGSRVAVIELAPLKEQIRRSLSEQRLNAVVAVGVGAVALALAAVGLAALVAFSVGRRTREIAVRMALGARIGDTLALILRESALLVGLGLVGGCLGAGLLGRMIGSLLYGVRPLDPVSVVAVSALLAAVALGAALIPARRAARVDPARALRGD